jgi:hypothetical protein
MDPTHLKAAFRKAKALVGLGNYRDAHDLLTSAVLKNVKEAASLAKECAVKNVQASTGEYNWNQILWQCARNPAIRLDVADYQSDAIGIQTISGKGFGVIATRDIKEGELLVVSKAVCVLFPSEIPSYLEVASSMDMEEGQYDTPNVVKLKRDLVASLRRRLHLKRQVLALSRGRPRGEQQQTSSSSSTSTSTTGDNEDDDDEDTLPEAKVLGRIVTYNAFTWMGWAEKFALRR